MSLGAAEDEDKEAGLGWREKRVDFICQEPHTLDVPDFFSHGGSIGPSPISPRLPPPHRPRHAHSVTAIFFFAWHF